MPLPYIFGSAILLGRPGFLSALATGRINNRRWKLIKIYDASIVCIACQPGVGTAIEG